MLYAKQSLLSAILLGAMLAASAPLAADQVTDSSITSWVNEALRHDPLVPASEISISTKEGVVTLSDTAYAVRRRILNNATIMSQGIVVTSVDASVTIQVANGSETEEAALLASAVGVKNVKNELATRYTATRSDQEIKNDAVAALHRDVYLTGFAITVAVKGGVVSLKGSVGNVYQKRRAAQAARRVSHVTLVENELVIRPEEKGELRQRAVHVSDDVLAKAIREELADDIRVNASEIEARACDGEVTLEGSATNLAQKRIAEQVAGRVRAVREVVNEIRVQPATGTNTQQSDATLAKAIRDGFRRHWTTSRVADRIHVGVKDGVATLTGDLDTRGERFEAGGVALGTEGVWKVQNRLTVNGHDYEWEQWEDEAPYHYEALSPNVG